MLRLRPYKKSDAKHIVSWFPDEFALHQWCADGFDHYPITADELNAQYEETAFNDKYFELTAYDEAGVAGHMFMCFRDEELKHVHFCYVVVDINRRGQGLGREMTRLAVKFAKEMLSAEKITLTVFNNNPAAHRCYLAGGFRDVPADAPKYYKVMGEEWETTQMEYAGE